MNNDLISISEAKKLGATCLARRNENGQLEAVISLDEAPTVEYTFEEAFQKTVCENRLYCPARPQGEWIDHSEDYGYVECPFCEHLTNCEGNKDELHYCWNCGAEMRKGDES